MPRVRSNSKGGWTSRIATDFSLSSLIMARKVVGKSALVLRMRSCAVSMLLMLAAKLVSMGICMP
ncbi:hypothetical protein D3C85_1842750 [compost metagenome]